MQNILNLFSNWDVDPLESSENLLSKLAIRACDWLDQRGKSPKQGCIVFDIFEIFQNKNTFQKKIKTLKNLFVFDQHIIEHMQHI